MKIVSIRKSLEIVKEKLLTLVVGDVRFNITCTPENLRYQ